MACKHSHKISDEMWARVMQNFNGKCWLCGEAATIVCPGSGDGLVMGECAAYCDKCHHLVLPSHRQVVHRIRVRGGGVIPS